MFCFNDDWQSLATDLTKHTLIIRKQNLYRRLVVRRLRAATRD